jgi:hypothetical protein
MKCGKALLTGIFMIGVFNSFSQQLKLGDQPTINTQKSVVLDVQGANGKQGLWLPRVSDTSITGIRALNPPDGLIIYHPPSGKIFLRSNNSWITYNTSAITNITAGAQTAIGPNVSFLTGTAAGAANDFNIVANGAANSVTYNMPDASTTARGVVTAGIQTLGGAKTFANGVTVNNGSTLNNGTTANNGLTVSGSTASTSNLTLGITAATPASTVGSNVLSVDSAGKVFLATTNIVANKPSRILNYTLTVNNGVNVGSNSSFRVNTPLPPGTTVNFPASVFISPSTVLSTGTTIDWATILNNNLVANISTRGNSQDLSGYIFYVTIIDF